MPGLVQDTTQLFGKIGPRSVFCTAVAAEVRHKACGGGLLPVGWLCDGRWQALFRDGGVQMDVADGWRDHRREGGWGDVESSEIVAFSLSMPNSRRFHGDKLWLHNSETG